VLVAPSWQIPPELEHDIPVIHEPLPSREDLAGALSTCARSVDVDPASIPAETRAAILDAASGLTLGEAEGAIALAYNGTGFLPDVISNEKMKRVRQSGYLTVSVPADIESLGGLGEFKRYVETEIIPAMTDPQLRVKGVLLVGIPGTGKSLAARVLAAMLKRCILRCDIGSLKDSKQGESERKLREALKLAEAVAPIVLWFDEIEKGVGGAASSSQTDGGTLLGMVGSLLTWMQEHTADIIIVATCNDYKKLPAELTRAGRFDERFFVDMPMNPDERAEIAAVHLKRFGANVDHASAITPITEGWTGAEIEQLVISTARRTARNITPEALLTAADDIKPISVVRKAEIEALREWGNNYLRPANTAVAKTVPTVERRIRRSA